MGKVSCRKVKLFKIGNRKGYACIFANNLTEGRTPLQAYQRMVKALRRCGGGELPAIDASEAKRLLTNI